MDKQDKLTNRQLLAIPRILSSSSVEEGCKKSGISRTTFYAWLKDDEFKTELKRQRDEIIQDAFDRLKCAITKATIELIKLMDSSREDIKRLACRDIIEYALKSIEIDDIEQKLDRVEKIILEGKSYK